MYLWSSKQLKTSVYESCQGGGKILITDESVTLTLLLYRQQIPLIIKFFEAGDMKLDKSWTVTFWVQIEDDDQERAVLSLTLKDSSVGNDGFFRFMYYFLF